MIGRQKRLKEVYDHLRKYYGVHTQTDFSDAIKYSRSVISSALNGHESYLTDKLFRNICEVYHGVFNLNYLLTGEGDLLTIEEDVLSERIEHDFVESDMYKALLDAKNQTIAQLELRIADKEQLIRTQQQLIDSLQQRIKDMQSADEYKKLDDYPFPGEQVEKDQYTRP